MNETATTPAVVQVINYGLCYLTVCAVDGTPAEELERVANREAPCGHCDAPTSMYGHFTHVAWWEPNDNPGSIGTGVKFPDGAGYFSCSAEYEQAVAALKEVRDAA